MAKHPRPTQAVQPAKQEAPPPEADLPPAATAPDGEPQAPAWGWTVALFVWVLCFGVLAIYELWTGMLMRLFWKG